MTTPVDSQPHRKGALNPKLHRLRRHISRLIRTSPSANADSSGFVVDGDERLLLGVEAAAREEIEQLYETLLKNANPMERQRLTKEMETAIEKRIHELIPPVSPEALF